MNDMVGIGNVIQTSIILHSQLEVKTMIRVLEPVLSINSHDTSRGVGNDFFIY